MAAVGLLVWVLISKYLDHLPLYRLEQIAARDQVILARFHLGGMGRTHGDSAAASSWVHGEGT
jgi:transposase